MFVHMLYFAVEMLKYFLDLSHDALILSLCSKIVIYI